MAVASNPMETNTSYFRIQKVITHKAENFLKKITGKKSSERGLKPSVSNQEDQNQTMYAHVLPSRGKDVQSPL